MTIIRAQDCEPGAWGILECSGCLCPLIEEPFTETDDGRLWCSDCEAESKEHVERLHGDYRASML